MKKQLEQLYQFIIDGKKSEAVHGALTLLQDKTVDVVTLYESVLEPALNEIECQIDDPICIWQEHIRTNIVRTIIESAYPYVEEAFQNNTYAKQNKKVLVVCPTEEYHEIGARIATDFFYLVGFDVIYVGANTPLQVILSAVTHEDPDILALSVTNRYHLSVTKHLIDAVKQIKPTISIYAGGKAFASPNVNVDLKPDKVLWTYADFKRLAKEAK